MVKTIDLTKGTKIDLTKPTNNIDLSKSNLTLDTSKVPALTLATKKPPLPTPKTPWDINFTDPVEGMKRISIPLLPVDLYYTPDEPADPEDCGRYPNSPYCGGIPFSFLPVGFEPEVVIDECNIGIGIQPVLFFIKLPQQQIVIRKENCRPTPPLPPTPSLVPASSFLPLAPPGCFYYIKFSHQIVYGGTEPEYVYGVNNDPPPPGWGGGRMRWLTVNGVKSTRGIDQRLEYDVSVIFKADGTRLTSGSNMIYVQSDSTFNFIIVDDDDPGTSPISVGTGGSQLYLVYGYTTRGGEIPPIYRYDPLIYYSITPTETLHGNPPYTLAESTLYCSGIAYDYNSENPPPPPFPALPPEPEEMNCCPQLTALLQLLLLRVNQLDTKVQLLNQEVKDTNRCLGVEEFPASLPKSLIQKDEGFLGNFIQGLDDQITIPNLTTLAVHFIKYFDELMGQWEIPIEVKDSDPATPGDQPIGFKIPNLAEGVAEMFGLMLQSSSNLELLVNMQTRTLIEVGQDKQQNFISYKLLQALVDYINFDYKEVGAELPMMFTPGEDEVDKMLVETMTKITVAEFDDKIDFQRHLLVLLEMAKMWKAQNFKKLELGDGMKQQIIDRIKALGQQSEELSIEKKDEEGKDQFDRFCEDVETQFASTPGILDAAHPYGGDFEDRPRIKKLGQ